MAVIISKTTPIKFWYLPLVLPLREVRPVVAVGHYSYRKIKELELNFPFFKQIDFLTLSIE